MRASLVFCCHPIGRRANILCYIHLAYSPFAHMISFPSFFPSLLSAYPRPVAQPGKYLKCSPRRLGLSPVHLLWHAAR